MYKLLVFLLVFIISVNAFADDDIITQNMSGACYIDTTNPIIRDIQSMSAVWRPNSYTCASGYYLPANAIECVQCAPDHTCPGGTYFFDPEQPHGIEYNTTLSQNASGTCVYEYMWPDGNQTTFNAVWEINSYDCDAGYYLPADGIECELCPENSYCSGGTYTYSETAIQGITECPNGWVSPTGAGDVGACGIKFHAGDNVVYLRSQKKTRPVLNVDVDGDGVADFFGNLTSEKTVMNNNTNLFLHVGEYYMYDDSVTPGTN